LLRVQVIHDGHDGEEGARRGGGVRQISEWQGSSNICCVLVAIQTIRFGASPCVEEKTTAEKRQNNQWSQGPNPYNEHV